MHLPGGLMKMVLFISREIFSIGSQRILGELSDCTEQLWVMDR